MLVAAVSSASLFLPRLLPAKIAAVALSAVAMRTDAEDGFARVAASWTKQNLWHVLDDKPPLRFGDDAENSPSNRRVIKKPRFLMRGDTIKDVAAEITSLANRRSAAHREKLRPLLIELKKRLPKGQFYSTLKKMGLTPSTVRVWHHRGRAADDIIKMLEEKPQKKPQKATPSGGRGENREEDEVDTTEHFLRQADKMAAAILLGNYASAARLAREYANARRTFNIH